MLSISEIEKYYPDNIKPFKRNILREYLQYKILSIMFESTGTKKLVFMGGTALRLIYGNQRFSEDLDFDNTGLTQTEFERLSLKVKKELELEGYTVETRNVHKGAYRCYIKIPQILFDQNLSAYTGEKINIQLDTEPQNFDYKPDQKIINKFDVFTRILVTPVDILLSQKIYAALNRKTSKGRDFFDLVFLLPLTKPNYNYLDLKLKISSPKELKKSLLEKCKSIDFKTLVKDVSAFIIDSKDENKILFFVDYIKSIDL